MKKWILFVGLALTVLCLFLHAKEPRWVSNLAFFSHDTLLQSTAQPARSGRVALVDLDEESLDELGQWPWPRFLVAELVTEIFDLGAAVVALDITFPEEDRMSPITLKSYFEEAFHYSMDLSQLPEEHRDYDQRFAKALAGGKSILGCYMDGSEGDPNLDLPSTDKNYRGYYFLKRKGEGELLLPYAEGVTLSIPVLNAAAANNAFFNTIPDSDGIIRRSPMVWAYGRERIYPSVALEAVRMLKGIPQAVINCEQQGEFEGVAGIQLGYQIIPTDPKGQLVINYRKWTPGPDGRPTSFPRFSAARVLAGEFPANHFDDQIVFIGTSAVGLRDLRATPLVNSFSGAEIQATMVDNMLAGDCLLDPVWMDAFEWVSIILIGFLITIIVSTGRSWLAFLLTLAVLAAGMAVSIYAITQWNILFLPSHLLLTAVLIYPVLTMMSYWQHEQRERWLRKTFGPMVSSNVMSYLEENPYEVSDLSRNTDVSVLFTDVRGFTSIAEQLTPEQTSALVKRFLTRVSQTVMDRDGYVDKYVGDLMMAVWGVPYAMENHAVQACDSALEQISALEEMAPEFKAEFGHEITVRIGVNSGPVTAGNMGSEDRFQYTVMGDTVNVAARLETLNGEYGTSILIGEETAKLADEFIEARLLDRVQVKGREETVRIYELLGRAGYVSQHRLQAARLYELALDKFWNDDLPGALECVELALDQNPLDAPSQRLRGIFSAAAEQVPS